MTTAKRRPGRPSKASQSSPSFEVKKDPVNNPAHYTKGEIECIDAIRAAMTKDQFIGYCKGCSLKYQWRFEHKGGVADLEKARWYLDRLIAEVKG